MKKAKIVIMIFSLISVLSLMPSLASQGTQIWDNGIWNGVGSGGLFSQNDTVIPLIAQGADDFIFENDTDIGGISWYGRSNAEANPLAFNIIFYADNGSGNEPTGGGLPDPISTAIVVYNLPSVSGTEVGHNGDTGTYWYKYNISFSTPFHANANQKYWMAIQSVVDYPILWSWVFSVTPTQLSVAKFGIPYSEIPFWTDPGAGGGYGDLTFSLYAPLPSFPPWDINQDGVVNYLDVSNLVSHYGETGTPDWIPEDINDDGTVNYLDVSSLVSHYGESY